MSECLAPTPSSLPASGCTGIYFFLWHFEKQLYTNGIPDPALVVRTSGESRISNFLLWQIAYSEIVITSTLWPAFRRRDLFKAILDYQSRERRYGKISRQVKGIKV